VAVSFGVRLPHEIAAFAGSLAMTGFFFWFILSVLFVVVVGAVVVAGDCQTRKLVRNDWIRNIFVDIRIATIIGIIIV